MEEEYGVSCIQMLKMFEKETFDKNFQLLSDSLDNDNWEKVMIAIHTIEGSSGY
jgi:hypothetical protein